MEYRNTKTGVIVNVESEISGNWERVSAPKPAAEVEDKPTDDKPKKKTRKAE